MDVNKEINKQLGYSIIWLVAGLLAVFAGNVLDFQRPIMNGIAIGSIPVGAGQIVLYSYIKKTNNKQMLRNLELEKEERNVFINTKAGCTAFWLSYGYIALALIVSSIFTLSVRQFLIVTIFFMPISYFSLLVIYHQKY